MQIGTHALQSDFDAESDTLYLYSKKVPVASSIELGNLIIDFAKDGSVVGIEFLNATQTLAHLLVVSQPSAWKDKTRLDSGMLSQIKKAHVSVHTEADLFIIAIELYTQDEQVLKGNLGLPIPTGSEKELLKILNST